MIKYQVTASALNIREKPNTNSRIVGRYLQGESPLVIGAEGGWFKTDKGWISGLYVSQTRINQAEPIKLVEVFVPWLRERLEPNHQAETIGNYEKDDKVEIFDKHNGWFRTKNGWIMGRFVRVLETFSPVVKAEYEYVVDHIPFSEKRRPGKQYARYNFSFQGVTIHNTANPRSNALGERGWLTNPSNNRLASWHIAVDEFRAVEAVPLNEISFHSGNFTGNNTTIGIEICEPNHDKSMKNAVHLTAEILKDQGWGIDRLYTHQHWSGKYCPNIILSRGLWGDFLNGVKTLL